MNRPPTPMPAEPSLLTERMPPAQLFLRLDGRIGRALWWRYGVLVPLLASVVGQALLDIARVAPQTASTLVNVLLFWPTVAVSAKRWHDLGRSGWWVLILLVPVVGVLWTIVANGFFKGTHGPNRFGPETDSPGWPEGQAHDDLPPSAAQTASSQ